MKAITVFCGSAVGSDELFASEAKLLGKQLANQNCTLVYGGAKIGLMGAVANGAMSANGKVIGVIPTFLKKKEVVHEGLSELIEVNTMHERKQQMSDLANGFIALPGGFGTLEELFEILTWAQLNRHQKPVGILNTAGYYDELLAFIHSMVKKKFLRPVNLDLMIVSATVDDLLRQMNKYVPPLLPRWK